MNADAVPAADDAPAGAVPDAEISDDEAFAAVFDAAAELDVDDATRIVRRGEDTPAIDEETRIVSRTAPPVPAPDRGAEPDFDEETRIVSRIAVPVPAPGLERGPEPDIDEGTRIVAWGDRPSPPAGASHHFVLDEETTRPVRRARRQAVADVAGPPASQPVVAAPSPAPLISTVPGLESGQRDAYPPRPLPEQQPLQRLHVEAVPRADASSAPRGPRARRVALTVLAVIVGAAALGAAIVAIVLLLGSP